jgi:signal transduction histidine kinase/streptogramin lyase
MALAFLWMGATVGSCSAPEISQYVHDSWGTEKGYLGGAVNAICQSSDGYLWIGTERGLVRFDGSTFTLIQRPLPGLPPLGSVRGLATDAEGNLWIQPEGPGVFFYRNGRFEDATTALGLQESTLTALAGDNDGNLLFSGPDNQAFLYSRHSLHTLLEAGKIPGTIISLAETRDGAIWMGTQDDGIYRSFHRHISQVSPLTDQATMALLPAQGGSILIGAENGILQWNNGTLTPLSLPSVKGKLQIVTMMRDPDGNAWVGTRHGLWRIEDNDQALPVRTISHPDDAVRALYHDRDGDIWLGTSRGIERLHEGIFRTFSVAQNLPTENDGPVYADNAGRIWFAPISGGLYWLLDGKIHHISNAGLNNDVIYSISGRKGEIWLGRQSGGLTVLRETTDSPGDPSFSIQTYTVAEGLAQNSVFSVYCDRDGSVWAGTVSGGVSLWKDGKFTTYTTAQGITSDSINSIIEAPNGTIWFATPNGLMAFSNGKWNRYSVRDGLPSADVRSVFEDANGVLWIATAAGLACYTHGHIGIPQHLPVVLSEPILGIAQDSLGSLWFTTPDHVLSGNRDKLLNGSLDSSDIESFGPADGLQEIDGVRRDRSLISDRLGRIWVSLSHGLAVADPMRSLRNATPGTVRIESLLAGSDPVDLNGSLNIAPGTRTIVFNYASMNLSAPDRIRYRYTLDGSGQGWSRIINSRQVVFSNLEPGKYQFRVIASNVNGLWNGPESDVSFEITPQVWQTWWFRVACFAAALLMAAALYRLRVTQLTQQLNMRFQERLAERTRIAQDLHDTLLQGILSASMQLDVAEDRVPEGSPAKPMLQRVLQLMRQVIDEGRRALAGLRSENTTVSLLEHAFSRLKQDFPIDERIEYRVHVQGESRPIRPIVHDDIWRIGREAIVNAVLHSGAASIEVDVEYLSRHLRLSVRDDGDGIDPKILQSGREGHWGLTGIRERAESIGATVRLRSRIGAGTEVELTVPGTIAFTDEPASRIRRWIARWTPGHDHKSIERNRQENSHD